VWPGAGSGGDIEWEISQAFLSFDVVWISGRTLGQTLIEGNLILLWRTGLFLSIMQSIPTQVPNLSVSDLE
jgi:hypothetical protein